MKTVLLNEEVIYASAYIDEYNRIISGGIIDLTGNEYLVLDYIDSINTGDRYVNGSIIRKQLVTPIVIPQSITKVQAMRAMKQTDVDTVAGTSMWTNFQLLLASNIDANDEWILALDLQRNHLLVLALTPVLGKTDTQIDELFVLAAGL